MVHTRLGARGMPVYTYTTLDDPSQDICKVYSMTSSAWASSVADLDSTVLVFEPSTYGRRQSAR